MAKLSTDELLDAFKEMTLIELSEFVKNFEETFGVTAAAPVAVAQARRRRDRGVRRGGGHPRGPGGIRVSDAAAPLPDPTEGERFEGLEEGLAA